MGSAVGIVPVLSGWASEGCDGGVGPWGVSGLCIVWHKNGNTVARSVTHWRCNAVFNVLNNCLLCVVLGDSCMGRCGGGQPAAPIGAQEAAAMGCAWLPRCFRQQALHFSAVGFESPGDKLSSKIARKKIICPHRKTICIHTEGPAHSAWCWGILSD